MAKIQGITVEHKDAIEDAGFVNGRDPFEVLCEVHGKPYRQYRERWNKACNFELETDYPIQLDFELNDSCNLRCDMCTWSLEHQKGKKTQFFPIEKFKEIILDGVPKGLLALNMSFVNEPLMRKDFPEFIRFARDNGIVEAGFNTNCMLLGERMQEELLSSGVTRIQFSVDAHSPDIYDKVRPGGKYETVVNNILAFQEKKAKYGVNTCLTAVTFVRMSVNEHQLVPFVEFWKNKVDYIIIREYLNPYGPSEAPFEDKARLFAAQKHIAKQFRCNKPWQRLIVRVDGTLVPCCTFFGPRLPMGNAFTDGIEKVWKGEGMNTLRQIHKNGEFKKNKVCYECAVSSVVDAD